MIRKEDVGRIVFVLVASAGLAMTVGCGKKQSPSSIPAVSGVTDGNGGAISDGLRKAADQTFASNCAVCHGPQGRGDGPGGKFLKPKPRNFTDAKWQATVTDDHIEQVIKYGGASVGLSPAMPAHPELLSHPDMVAALREHIRSLSGK